MKSTLSTRLRSVIFQLACLVAAACVGLSPAQAEVDTAVVSTGQTWNATTQANRDNSYRIWGTLQYAVPQSAYCSSCFSFFYVYSGGVLSNTGYLVIDYLSAAVGSTIQNERTGTINLILGGSSYSNIGTFINLGTVLAAHDVINTGTLKNEGTISGGGNYTQTAGVTINDGTIQRTQINFTGGTASGHGTYIAGNGSSYVGDINVGSGATIDPTGALTFKGNLTSAGKYTFDLGSTSSDSLVIDGTASFTGGAVSINLLDIANLVAGESWTLISATSFAGLSNLSFTVSGLSSGLSYVIDTTATTVSLRLTSAAPVPEPESLALALSGIVVCGLRLRRNKALA